MDESMGDEAEQHAPAFRLILIPKLLGSLNYWITARIRKVS